MSQRYIGGLIYNPPGGFSGYFDGSGDSLSVADNAAFEIGSGDFTIEAWIYLNAYSSVYSGSPPGSGANDWGAAICAKDATTGRSYNVVITGTASSYTKVSFQIYSNDTTATTTTANFNFSLGRWYHFAAVRSGTSLRLYVDGVDIGGGTNSVNAANTATTFKVGTIGYTGYEYWFPGYISNLRLVKGTAVYTTNFTPPVGPLQAITNTSLLTCAYPTFRDGSTNNFTITVNGNTAVSTQNPFPLTQLPNPALGNAGNGVYTLTQYQSLRSQNLWPALDQYFDYVTLLLHGNGTNGAQNNTFLDSSTNNFTITRNGNTTQGTFSPYGENWSNYFDGNVDGLELASNSVFVLDTNITMETWVFPTASAEQCVAGMTDSGGSSNWDLYLTSSNTVRFRWINTAVAIYSVTSSAIAVNQWTHIAATINGTTLTLYINGVSAGSTTLVGSARNNARPIGIGRPGNFAGSYFNGYISNFRYVRGSVVYTANFTPPTQPLTAITNTSLLTCQSNRFRDASANNFTITRNGDVSVQKFSPFNPTAAYNPAVVGASGYFDGTGDYLSTPTLSTIGSGDFSQEAWVYTQSNSGTPLFWDSGVGTGTFLLLGGSTNIQGGINGTLVVTATYTLPLNSWVHLVYCRSGTTLSIFANGTRIGTATASTSANAGSYTIGIAKDITRPFTGYMCGVRFVHGSSAYDATASTITVPTAPVTAITNTSLLLNFTNAGVIDNSALNNLETVGNAQISTAQSRFGGASLAFDGNGDRLTIPGSSNIVFGIGDFTIEYWMYPLTNTSTNRMMGNGTSPYSANDWSIWPYNATGKLAVDIYNISSTANAMVSTTTMAPNAWYHVALVRSGNVFRLFINGNQESTVTSSVSFDGGVVTPLYVGDSGFSEWYNGYIDDLRITKGIARYTTNFVPQRSQWQDQ